MGNAELFRYAEDMKEILARVAGTDCITLVVSEKHTSSPLPEGF
jgi:hypothetical protein